MLGRMKVVSEAVYSQNLQPTKHSLANHRQSALEKLFRNVIGTNSDATHVVNGSASELLS